MHPGNYLNWKFANFNINPLGSPNFRLPSLNIPKSTFSDYTVESFHNVCGWENKTPTTLSIQNDIVASTNDAGEIAFHDKNTMDWKVGISAHSGHSIYDLKWRQYNSDGSPNNAKHFITASGDRSIKVFDAEKMALISTIDFAHPTSVKTLSFYDANLFASGGRDGTVKLWDLRHLGPYELAKPKFVLINVHSPSVQNQYRRTNFQVQGKPKYPPSNGVTSVAFKPQFKYHFYTAGCSDNSIYMWDIRSARRQYKKVSKKINPAFNGVHTIKNCTTNGSIGYYRLKTISIPKFGNVLLAQCSDQKIYAFINDETDPAIAFYGAKPCSYSAIDVLNNDFLLGGSTDAKVYVWSLREELERLFASDNPENVVHTAPPTHCLPIGVERETCDLIAADKQTNCLYNVTESFKVIKWSLHDSRLDTTDLYTHFTGRLPKAVALPTGSEPARTSISLKRKLDSSTTLESKRLMPHFFSRSSPQSSIVANPS